MAGKDKTVVCNPENVDLDVETDSRHLVSWLTTNYSCYSSAYMPVFGSCHSGEGGVGGVFFLGSLIFL